MKKLLLLDIDGTVLERAKIDRLQQEKSQELFGRNAENILDVNNFIYESCRGENGEINIDEVIDITTKALDGSGLENPHQLRELYYGLDFKQCIDRKGWDALMKLVEEHDMEIVLFSQGSVEYQQKKAEQLCELSDRIVGREIFLNKMPELENVIQKYRELGYKIVGLLDDNEANTDQAKVFGIEGFLVGNSLEEGVGRVREGLQKSFGVEHMRVTGEKRLI